MKYLALDVGTKRTGIAYLDDVIGVPVPLDTFTHGRQEELVTHVMEIVHARKIDEVIVGLPLLPSGEPGAQAKISSAVGTALQSHGVRVTFSDERYTTPRNSAHKHAISTKNLDGDAAAACSILSQKVDI
ncbi:Holliday junction resolvase RuvX [Candidatus Peribacteria bacterium]|nr:Holliday junction resolvase RuvX [Candidatus Peribacteria bacterium]